MTSSPHPSYLLFLGALAALPLVVLTWRRRRAGPRLPRQWGRGLLCLALALLVLVWADRLRGVTAVLGLCAIGYGLLAGERGMRAYHQLRYGGAVQARWPRLAAEDAVSLHLFFMISAVACVTAGIVVVTWPRVT